MEGRACVIAAPLWITGLRHNTGRPHIRPLLHIDKSRGQMVVEKLLGEVFGSVLVR